MKNFCSTIMRHIRQGTPLVLVTLVAQEGSAPRLAGARMLVLPGGVFHGTVGGGLYEAVALKQAAAMHAGAGESALLLEFSLRGVSDMDMVCGGSLRLLLEYIPGKAAAAPFLQGAEAERCGKDFALVSALRVAAQSEAATACTLYHTAATRFFVPGKEGDGPAGDAPGRTPDLPPDVLARARGGQGDIPLLTAPCEATGLMYLIEFFPASPRLFLFGAGHVSAELALLAARVDFSVLVADDRPEFANAERFADARISVLPSLLEKDCAEFLAAEAVSPRDAVAIITRGHAHDRDALAAALATPAGYIGMIGSRSKREAVYKNLREQGVTMQELTRVHSPIGLAIGADTPAEIAISIVAELVAWRRKVSATGRQGS